MSAPIEIVHPAPLRFVRQGCRKPEDDCVQVHTQAVLPTADEAAFRSLDISVGGTFDAQDLHEHEGGIWTPLMVNNQGTKLRGIRPFELKKWLSGGMTDASLASCITHALAGSPLVQVRIEMLRRDRNDANMSWRTTTGRGAAKGEIEARSVLHDGENLARDTVRDFLAERVRVAGQKVFVRVVPFARYVPIGTGSLILDAGLQSQVFPDFLARPDRASDLVEDWSPEPASHAEVVRRVSTALPPGTVDDALIGWFANTYPRFAVALVEASAGLRDLDRKVLASLREQANALRKDALLGGIGGVTDREAAILRSAAVFGAIANAYPEGPEARTARRFHGHVHRRIIPLLDTPIDGADAEALNAALMP